MKYVLSALLLCFTCFACAAAAQEARYVASTSRVVFGYDEEGNTVWKREVAGRTLTFTICDSLFVAWQGADTAAVLCGDLATGKERLYLTFPGKLLMTASERDSLGRPVLYCTIEKPGEMVYIHVDPYTGVVRKSWSRRMEARRTGRREGWVCPVSLRKEVNLVATDHFVCAFDSVARLVWKIPRREGETLQPFGESYAVLRADSSFRVVDRFSGRVLWEKRYDRRILSIMGDEEHLQVALSDGTYRLYRPRSGAPFRP